MPTAPTGSIERSKIGEFRSHNELVSIVHQWTDPEWVGGETGGPDSPEKSQKWPSLALTERPNKMCFAGVPMLAL